VFYQPAGVFHHPALLQNHFAGAAEMYSAAEGVHLGQKSICMSFSNGK